MLLELAATALAVLAAALLFLALHGRRPTGEPADAPDKAPKPIPRPFPFWRSRDECLGWLAALDYICHVSAPRAALRASHVCLSSFVPDAGAVAPCTSPAQRHDVDNNGNRRVPRL